MHRVSPADLEAAMGGMREEKSDIVHRVAAFVSLGCCISVFTVFMLVAFIVGFVGLAHTQHVTLDPMCPAGYWSASLSLILTRIAFIILGCALTAAVKCCCSEDACMAVCTTLFGLCCTLSMTVANTTVTAAAWNAPNCTDAVRASRDADPLLMASGSLFIMLDFIFLILGCAGACVMCCKSCGEAQEN